MPFFKTIASRALTEHWNDTMLPSCHISVDDRIARHTGCEKRASNPSISV